MADLQSDLDRLSDDELKQILFALQQSDRVKNLGFSLVSIEQKKEILAALDQMFVHAINLRDAHNQAQAKKNKGRRADPDTEHIYRYAAAVHDIRVMTWEQISAALAIPRAEGGIGYKLETDSLKRGVRERKKDPEFARTVNKISEWLLERLRSEEQGQVEPVEVT